jgi:hypothetical protein
VRHSQDKGGKRGMLQAAADRSIRKANDRARAEKLRLLREARCSSTNS